MARTTSKVEIVSPRDLASKVHELVELGSNAGLDVLKLHLESGKQWMGGRSQSPASSQIAEFSSVRDRFFAGFGGGTSTEAIHEAAGQVRGPDLSLEDDEDEGQDGLSHC